MENSLALATWITGVIMLGFGILFFKDLDAWRQACRTFLRSQKAAFVLMAIGCPWFFLKLYNLSPADQLFGENTRWIFLGLFGFAWIGSFKWVPDFLSVRGLAIILLLAGGAALEAAFGLYEIPQRLFLVTLVYLFLALALVLGWSPYKLRDWFEWLHEDSKRSKILGGLMAGYGAILLVTGFTYGS